MNDFTKEELENILNGNIELYPHTYRELRSKIQSMIENYNQHQFKVPDDMESSWLAWKYQNE